MPELLTQSDELRLRTRLEGQGVTASRTASAVQKEIVLRLLAEGATLIEAARAVKRTGTCVSKWMQDPEMKEKLRQINELAFSKIDQELKQRAETTISRMRQASEEALDKVLELMQCADSEAIQMRCAMDILDRNPETSKVHKIDKREVRVNIDSKFLEAAAIADAELGSSTEPNGEVLNAS